jgi:DNA-binding NarL/FixJ family response regulator
MNGEAELHLLLSDRASQGVADCLSRLSRRTVRAIQNLFQSQESAVLLAASSQCSPAECEELTRSGRKVIVLAALPSDEQRSAYLAAGAAGYLPMAVDTRPLLDLIDEVDGRRPPSGGVAV